MKLATAAFGDKLPFREAARNNVALLGMAERQGFEPWRRFPAYTLSRRAPSTTRPPLRAACLCRKRCLFAEDQKLANRPCPSAHRKPMFMDKQATGEPRSTYASDALRTSGLRSQMSRWANGISISSSAKRLAISWFISDLTVNTQFTSRRIARISNSSASPPKA